MRRNTFLLAILVASLIGCRPPAASTSSSSGGNLGDNSEILKSVFDSALGGYQLEGAEIQWSGADSNEEFSRRGSVTVKEANLNEVADLLDKQLETLPVTHEWKSHGSGRTKTPSGDSYLGLFYEKNGANYYLDLILSQHDKDVDIFVLSKGVRTSGKE